MLRITVQTDKIGALVQLEGRLAGSLVQEVERCWDAARRDNQGRPLRVDLRSVTYIDSDGKALLRRLHQQGAGLIAAGCLTRSYVEEITRCG